MYALKMLFRLCDVFNLHVVQGIFQPCSVRIFFMFYCQCRGGLSIVPAVVPWHRAPRAVRVGGPAVTNVHFLTDYI
jgi:hypothetical protein